MSVIGEQWQRQLGFQKRSIDISQGVRFDPNELHQKDVIFHTGCVNSLEFSLDDNFLATGGDDMRVVLWSVSDAMVKERPKPLAIMKTRHMANIFAHKFSHDNSTLYTGGNDNVCIAHDMETGKKVWDNRLEGAVHNVDINPYTRTEVAITRNSTRSVCFVDPRDPREQLGLLHVAHSSRSYSAQYNPVNSHLIAVAADYRGALLYDRRNIRKPLLDVGDMISLTDAMFARWNGDGNALAIVIPSSYPVVVDFLRDRMIRLKDPTYQNSHTVKSVEWINNKSVVTGSDNFSIYGWDMPHHDPGSESVVQEGEREVKSVETVKSASFIMKGHRSIVNQVRYSNSNRLIVSSGVEKLVKIWSPLAVPGSYKSPSVREVGSFSHSRRIDLSDSDELDDEDDNDQDGDSAEESRSMLMYFDHIVLSTGNDNLMVDYPRRARFNESDDDIYLRYSPPTPDSPAPNVNPLIGRFSPRPRQRSPSPFSSDTSSPVYSPSTPNYSTASPRTPDYPNWPDSPEVVGPPRPDGRRRVLALVRGDQGEMEWETESDTDDEEEEEEEPDGSEGRSPGRHSPTIDEEVMNILFRRRERRQRMEVDGNDADDEDAMEESARTWHLDEDEEEEEEEVGRRPRRLYRNVEPDVEHPPPAATASNGEVVGSSEQNGDLAVLETLEQALLDTVENVLRNK